ncbi:MAG: MiaB/RimO family radical SAM methylthiotransferase [Candidatus Eremiobacteraeota bacterium]|nr:MiaB/RimO family radical SAM methylthiotransferase [Candidatus Eremiobacteraeota bacterium]
MKNKSYNHLYSKSDQAYTRQSLLYDLNGKSFNLYTFGCKVNQYESERIRQALISRGGRSVNLNENPDIVIINTCTVTAEADRQCRQMARRASKLNPGARIYITGCLLNNPDAISRLPRNVFFLKKEPFLDELPGKFYAQNRTRALLNIQDGCNHFCTYCIVPYVRGRSKSRTPGEIIKEASLLVNKGHRELVICGIHLGMYGKDLGNDITLEKLLYDLSIKFPTTRLRLSSIEPMDLSPGFISAITSISQICPHLHLPLQHSHPLILKKMKRGYTGEEYADLINRILRKRPGISLSTDCMVGFPGEGEEEYEHLYNFIENMPFMRLHVFSYSPRPMTLAADLPGQLAPDVKKRRSKRLLELGRKKQKKFLDGLMGKYLEVIVEKRFPGGVVRGTGENYATVEFHDSEVVPGDMVRVLVTGRHDEICEGIIKEKMK